MKFISTTFGATVPGNIVLGPDGNQWEVFPGGWIASLGSAGGWQLVKDPNIRVVLCVPEESDAIAAVAAHFTIESMEIIDNGS